MKTILTALTLLMMTSVSQAAMFNVCFCRASGGDSIGLRTTPANSILYGQTLVKRADGSVEAQVVSLAEQYFYDGNGGAVRKVLELCEKEKVNFASQRICPK